MCSSVKSIGVLREVLHFVRLLYALERALAALTRHSHSKFAMWFECVNKLMGIRHIHCIRGK